MDSLYSTDKMSFVCSQGTSAREKNRLSPYRKFLLHLSTDLPKEALKRLKFACLDVVLRAKMEEVTAAFQLFDLLEQKGAITPQNLTLLEDMMQAIGRDDLASKVIQFMEDVNGMERQSCCKYASLGVLLKAGPRPSGPRPTARQGPAARRPDGLTARRPAAHGPPRPGGPVSFNQFCSMPQSTCPQVSCPQGLQRPCPVALFRNTFATFPLCTRNCYNMFVPVL